MLHVIQRLITAILTIPATQDWIYAALLLLIYAVISLPIGLKYRFIQFDIQSSRKIVAAVMLGALVMPGITEELFFRVLLLPHPTENASLAAQLIWGSISLIVFIVYHPLNIFAPGHDVTFRNPVFLLLAALLGIVCTVSYLQSGSLWPPVVIHWLIVVVWLLLLGGYRELHG
ncbi:CPBP family intramembrane metalloprotease [Microcoleus sp. FACHB-831]|uniref:CPBP family glutamic-type intramembrane protease n=1 Tax=Microcoleus sp. FACHB-831 TaxID=2692827 RepID=UPI001689875A|nr:CPBP family glutamic-type intramembrane protease [Microcoleus sp. FACHB-831]MBD1922358.1 CPBP family intramembrane metalloprotease [Microcoleus sp. FACHB-831]